MHKPTCRFAPVKRMSEMWLGKGDGKKSPTDLLKVKLKVEEEWEKEEKEAAVVAKSPPLPRFAHIIPTVRKKEERKKLIGLG